MDYIIGQNRPQKQEGIQGNASSGSLIVNADQRSFMPEVIETSHTLPVLVDFWAPWCGPCKQLTPILEKLVTAAGGLVKLVKVDIEANAALAAQLTQIGLPLQSIPLVAAFYKGQIVDIVQGAQPVSEMRRFIEQIVKSTGATLPGADLLTEAANALQQGHFEEAASHYASLLEIEADNPEGWGGLIRALTALGDAEAADEALSQVPAKLADHAAISGARAALELSKESRVAASALDKLRADLTVHPEDLTLRFQFAGALNGAGHRPDAAEELLTIIRTDRDWHDGAARTELLRFFEAWGNADPATLSARRKLSTLLFS